MLRRMRKTSAAWLALAVYGLRHAAAQMASGCEGQASSSPAVKPLAGQRRAAEHSSAARWHSAARWLAAGASSQRAGDQQAGIAATGWPATTLRQPATLCCALTAASYCIDVLLRVPSQPAGQLHACGGRLSGGQLPDLHQPGGLVDIQPGLRCARSLPAALLAPDASLTHTAPLQV